MPYELYMGDDSSNPITFDDFKNAIGETHAGRVSLIGGRTQIRQMIDPLECSLEQQQELTQFTENAARFYVLQFESLDQAESTEQQLDQSDLPLVFFRTHGSGKKP